MDINKVCKIEGCNKKHKARGYCSMHLSRVDRHGDPFYERPAKCKVPGCNSKYKSNGYCKKHYSRWARHGDPMYTEKERHGMHKTKEYNSWAAMIQRCTNKNTNEYKNYGGRGITVCDRWKKSFIDFYKDMGEKPFPHAQIDRINNDGNYEPNNCRWVSPKTNNRNKRNTKITMVIAEEIRRKHKGGNIRIIELSKQYGLNSSNICNIIANRLWKKGA